MLIWFLGLHVDDLVHYGAICGSLGAAIVFVLRLDLTGFLPLAGAEINAHLEQGRPQTYGVSKTP